MIYSPSYTKHVSSVSIIRIMIIQIYAYLTLCRNHGHFHVFIYLFIKRVPLLLNLVYLVQCMRSERCQPDWILVLTVIAIPYSQHTTLKY